MRRVSHQHDQVVARPLHHNVSAADAGAEHQRVRAGIRLDRLVAACYRMKKAARTSIPDPCQRAIIIEDDVEAVAAIEDIGVITSPPSSASPPVPPRRI